MARKKFIKKAIKRPGALTKAVGGKPSDRLSKVRYLVEHGTAQQKREARFYLNVLRPAARKGKAKS